MKTHVSHFWTQDADGTFKLYEVDYANYSICEGARGSTMVHSLHRLYACTEQDLQARRSAAVSN